MADDSKVNRALQVDRVMKHSAGDVSQSPSSQFAAELTGQYNDSVVSKYSPQPGRADKHASNIPGDRSIGSAKGTIR